MTTIRDLDDAGFDLRLWCYRCERAATVDGIIWMEFEERGWPMEVGEARKRFRCSRCRSNADVLLVTTRRKERPLTPERVAEALFHGMRRKGRRA